MLFLLVDQTLLELGELSLNYTSCGALLSFLYTVIAHSLQLLVWQDQLALLYIFHALI